MPAITSATITAFYLFDVAEQIDLTALRAAIGGGAIHARFTTKSAAPSYLQYATPPVIVDGEALDIADVDGFKLRVKFFDYGVLSLALSRPFSGEWPALLGLSQIYVENAELERRAEKIARRISERFAAMMPTGRTTFLSEDYLVVAITGLATPVSGRRPRRRAVGRDRASRARRTSAAQPSGTRRDHEQPALVSRRRPRRADVEWRLRLRHRARRAGGARDLRVRQLPAPRVPLLRRAARPRAHAHLRHPAAAAPVSLSGGRGYIAATQHLHALFIDVNEITDRTENALKMVGDVYSARLFHLTAARLGLASWKASVNEKLETLDDIYRFAVEQIAISRGHFLELTIILILVLELVLFFLGIMT